MDFVFSLPVTLHPPKKEEEKNTVLQFIFFLLFFSSVAAIFSSHKNINLFICVITQEIALFCIFNWRLNAASLERKESEKKPDNTFSHQR